MSKFNVTTGVNFEWRTFSYSFDEYWLFSELFPGEDFTKFLLARIDAVFTATIMILIIYKFIKILTRGDELSDEKGLENMINLIGIQQKSSVHRFFNFVSSCTVPFISVTILAIFLTLKSNIFLIWIILTIYVISIVTFATFLNTLFKNKTFGIFIFFSHFSFSLSN